MNAAPAELNELRELYRELILDHARSPRNFGKPPQVSHSAEGINPLCGDKLQLFLHLTDDGRIDDIGFEGSGCAISVASASLMSESVGGMQKDAALRYSEALTSRLSGNPGNDNLTDRQKDIELGKLRALEGVREFPSRVKCATLAWHALRAALNTEAQSISTE